ncbi:site-specific DNA-methyltransferase [Microbacterium sp. CnD16-F]|uniref:site-specific DNA-methyltransferase n=1 Tax=Microbacterium sp. CnD16-F TaxID=2954493 RepID=UPI0020980AF1|nr:site-specific DNA-methyltransferase [Microbacterium sp. CnD16-F]MCO7202123.1 site-specific DNA-methyltransferase [Microbacterium sp. CnD16-F]
MTDDIHETPSSTPNFQSELAAQLAELIPEAIADGKIDVTKLQELLSTDAADPTERFGLFWPGKKRALRAAQEPTTATLRPDFENSKDWDTTKNVFIEGDNLEVLKILQKHYHNKVKLIYIDPPYNTGKDFVYPDNFKEGLDTYLEWTRQVNEEGKKVSTNAETEGRYHSNWLNMMYPRLKLARNLLTDDGVIFVSIDDHEYDNLKKLCDGVFGEANYLNTFVWVSNLKGRQISASGAAGTKEYILCYARKGDQAGEFRASGSRLKSLMPTVYKGFNYTAQADDRGPFVVKNELYNTNSAFNEITRPNLVFDIYFNPTTGDVKTASVSPEHAHEGYIKIAPKQNNNGTNKYHAFRWSARKVQAESYDLHFVESASGWKVYTKVRDVDSATVKDLVMDITTNEGSADIGKLGLDSKWFDYPKPVNLIKMLVDAATDSDSMVLDFFAGSGTTAHAVMQLNADDGGRRRFIQVQLPEPLAEDHPAREVGGHRTIADVSIARVRAAATSIDATLSGRLGDGEPADMGVRVLKLAETNFAKWRVTSDVEEGALEQHLLALRDSSSADDATPDDLLTEILLKQGYALTERITSVEIEGLELRAVLDADGDVAVLAYLNEHKKPSVEQLRAIVDTQPTKLVILEDAFQGDDELKTNLVQLAKSKNVELWTA